MGETRALNLTQGFGSVAPVSTEAVVTAAAPLTAHTCPAGRTQRCFAIYIVTLWGGTGRNLRARVQGVQIKQFNDTDQPVNSMSATLITPEFTLGPGDTVSVTTQNSGTEGGTIRVSVLILEDKPAP